MCRRARAEITRLQAGAREERTSACKDWMRELWKTQRKRVFEFVGEGTRSMVALQRADGSLTSNFAEIDELLCTTWAPIFQRYAASPEPTWEAFERRFGNCVAHARIAYARMTVAELRDTLLHMNDSATTGVDNWSVKELRLLPDALLERLCELYGEVERLGYWPEQLTTGLVTPVPKEPGSLRPIDVRPITVMPTLYRLWGATRMRHLLLQWQESWIHPDVASYRPFSGCEDVWWLRALELEEALLRGTPIAGMSLDLMKCFDSLPHSVLFGMAAKAGMPSPILAALKGMYRQLRRRWKTGPMIGRSFESTNGIIQGCAISVLLLNIFASTWAAAVHEHVPGSRPKAYADDMGSTADSPQGVLDALRLSDEFMTLADMRVSAGKSNVWATSADFRAALQGASLSGERLKQVEQDRLLGAHLAFSRRAAPTTLTKRLPECVAICERIEAALLPLEARACLVASAVVSKSTYAAGACTPHKKKLRTLRASCCRAVWGQANRWRAPEIVFTTMTKGHIVDPQQAYAYSSLQTARRVLRRHPECWETFCNVLSMRQEGDKRAQGPVKSVMHAVRVCGGRFLNPGLLQLPVPAAEPPELWLTERNGGRFSHHLREALRLEQWRRLARRRSGFEGIQDGIDRAASQGLKGRLRGLEGYRLRCLQAGAIPTLQRLHQMKACDSNLCPHCGELETTEHILRVCSAYDEERFREVSPELWAALPDALALRGICPLGFAPHFTADERAG